MKRISINPLSRERLGHSISSVGAFLFLGAALWTYRRWVYPFDGAVTALLVLLPLAAFPFLGHHLRPPRGLSWLLGLLEEGSYLMVPLCFIWAICVFLLLGLRALGPWVVLIGLPSLAPVGLVSPPWDLWLSLVGSIGAVAMGLREASRVRVRRLLVNSPVLPRGRSIRVAQISDLHLGMVNDRSFLRRLVGTLRELRPDLLVSTGDLLDGPSHGLEDLAAQIRSLNPPMGAFAVLGNHEHYAGVEMALDFHRRCGFEVLQDRSVNVGPIRLVGIDDAPSAALGRQRREEEDRLWGSLGGDDASGFTMVLKHRPVLRKSSAGRFHLMLCGHVHGGQIFPLSLIVRSAYRHSAGLITLKGDFLGGLMYVSAGTGTWGAPVRLLAPPEVTVFDLVYGLELRGKEAKG